MANKIPSIERCFEIYCSTHSSVDIDPLSEDEQRAAFFCGFEACLQAVDLIAFITVRSEVDGQKAWDSLQGEWEKFATQFDCGDISINH